MGHFPLAKYFIYSFPINFLLFLGIWLKFRQPIQNLSSNGKLIFVNILMHSMLYAFVLFIIIQKQILQKTLILIIIFLLINDLKCQRLFYPIKVTTYLNPNVED
jgi:hypothetical protein